MDIWKAYALQVIDLLLQHPTTVPQQWITISLALIVGLWLFNKIADTFDVLNLSGGTVLGCLVAGVVLVVGAIVAGRINMPEIFLAKDTYWPMIAAALVVSVVVVIPVMKLIVHGGYFVLLLAWLVSAMAALGIIFMTSAGFDTYHAMTKNIQKGKVHNDEIFWFLNR